MVFYLVQDENLQIANGEGQDDGPETVAYEAVPADAAGASGGAGQVPELYHAQEQSYVLRILSLACVGAKVARGLCLLSLLESRWRSPWAFSSGAFSFIFSSLYRTPALFFVSPSRPVWTARPFLASLLPGGLGPPFFETCLNGGFVAWRWLFAMSRRHRKDKMILARSMVCLPYDLLTISRAFLSSMPPSHASCGVPRRSVAGLIEC